MATFGENLRHERALRGITLPELANATKISLRHLTALENDQFDRLPGGVYNRSFVRAVARYMNLDEHYWVREFVRAAHEEPEIVAPYASPNQPTPTSPRRRPASFALLVVVFAAGAYWIHEVRLRRAAEASAPLLTTSPSVSPPQTRPSSPPPLEPARDATAPTQRNLTLAAAPPPSTARATQSPAELLLQVDALQDTWISVAVDGQALYRGLMKPGETRSFRGAQRVRLTTGNASAVVLTLNGETLAPLGNPGERKTITLTAKDLARSTP